MEQASCNYSLGQHLVALCQHIHQYGLHAAHEALHGNHHQDEAHKAHHDVVARLAQDVHQPGGGPEDEVGQQVDESNGADEHAFQFHGLRVLHQHDGVGDGTRAAEHRDAQRGDGDVVGVSLDFLVLQLHVGVAGLQHVIANLEDDDAACNAETIGGDAEELEQELTGEGEDHDDDEGREGGAGDDEAPFLLGHALSHGQEHGHGAQRVGQREEGGQAEQGKG